MKWNCQTLLFAFLLLGLFWGHPWAQQEDYFSAQSLEELPAQQVTPSHEFIYRVQLDTTFRFYKLRMSDGLYRTKKAFLWPESFSPAKRAQMPLFGSEEVLFNDRLVLADVEALYYKVDTGLVALPKIDLPGIVFLRSPHGAIYQEIDVNGIQPERPLPAALYTFKDTTKVCLIRSLGLIPREYDPYTPMQSFRHDEITLDSIPVMRLLPHFLNDGMENAGSDSASFDALQKKILELEKWHSQDSILVAEYLQNLRTQYAAAMPLRPYEDSSTYFSRVRVRDVEALALTSVAYAHNQFSKAMLPLRERIHELKTLRNALAKEQAFQREPRNAYLFQGIWKRLTLSVTTPLARNLPDWATSPGPSAMWGIGGRLEYQRPFWKTLAYTVQGSGGYSQWNYHTKVTKSSTEQWGGLGAGFSIPLWVKPMSVAFVFDAGILGVYRNIEVQNGFDFDHRWGTTPGLYAGTTTVLSSLALQWTLRYQYFHDGFGDLQMSLGFPLPFIGGKP